MQCWGARIAAGRLKDHPRYKGLAEPGEPPQWTGEVRLNHDLLDQVERWRKPRVVFVAPSADLFHKVVPDQFIHALFGLMSAHPEHTFLVLTKRAGRMAAMVKMWEWACWDVPGNIWMGVSVEDEGSARDRLDHLTWMNWPHKWVSVEPLLGPIDPALFHGVGWIVIGGESGRWARAMHPQWARDIIKRWGTDYSVTQRISVFFKQWGAWAPFKTEPRRAVRTGTLAWVDLDGNMYPYEGWSKPVKDARLVSRTREEIPETLGREWRELPWH
jgi:protein gp37